MELVIALFIIFGILIQIGNFIDWFLGKLGFFKTPVEKICSSLGYTTSHYWGGQDIVCIKAIGKELYKLQTELYENPSDSRSMWFKRQNVSFAIDSNNRAEKWYYEFQSILNK